MPYSTQEQITVLQRLHNGTYGPNNLRGFDPTDRYEYGGPQTIGDTEMTRIVPGMRAPERTAQNADAWDQNIKYTKLSGAKNLITDFDTSQNPAPPNQSRRADGSIPSGSNQVPPELLKQLSGALADLQKKLPNATPEQRAAILQQLNTISTTLAQFSTTGQRTVTPPPADATQEIKTIFKNTSAYRALGTDAKNLVDLAFSTFSGTPEQQQIFTNALTQAQALADPYAKAQLALFSSEFRLQIAKTNNDYEEQAKVLDETRTNIADTLKLNQDNLTLEQQAALATEARSYGEDLLTVSDVAAEKGLTFATGYRSRTMAEDRRTAQYQDVVQSDTRAYNYRTNSLKLAAAQGDTKAMRELSNLPTKQNFDLRNIGINAEKILGSGGVSDLGISGYNPSGGNLGDIEQNRRKAIIDAARLGVPTS